MKPTNSVSLTCGGGPLSQVSLRVHGLCDLSCPHCYIYEAADQNWRTWPQVISDEVFAQVGPRFVESTGPRQALQGTCRLDASTHANGIWHGAKLCELFARHQVKASISADGVRAANDRHRQFADGRSSYDNVIQVIELNAERSHCPFGSLLSTIDVANDARVAHEPLMAPRPSRIDFLVPNPTWGYPPRQTPGVGHEYADWLTAGCHRWIGDRSPSDGTHATGMNVFSRDLGMIAGHDRDPHRRGTAGISEAQYFDFTEAE